MNATKGPSNPNLAARLNNMGVSLPSLGGPVKDEPLTPETLIVYCQTRLKNLDTQINEKLREQRSNIRAVESLNNAQSAISGCMKDIDGDGKYKISKDQAQEAVNALDRALADPNVTGEDRKNLESARASFEPLTQAGGSLPKDTVKAASDNVDRMVKDRNSTAELNMIGVQSLMSQRQTAIQLTTNMMSAINDSLKSIAANTKG